MCLLLREARQRVLHCRRALCYAQIYLLLGLTSQIAWGQISPPKVKFPAGATPAPSITPPASSLPAAPAFPATPPGGTPPAAIPAPPKASGFDPYADPTLPTSPYQAPAGMPPPVITDPAAAGQKPLFSEATFGQWPRFLQQIRFRQNYLNRGGLKGLGWMTTDLSGSFLFPISFMPKNAPLLVTPGFALDLISGPGGQFPPPPSAQMPPRLYSGYLDFGWSPQLTHGLSADLGFRPGIYSDFNTLTSKSWRWQGRAFGVWQTNAAHQWRAGIVYIDRLTIKLLPAGGLVWNPGGSDGKVRCDILFPNPKFAYRLNSFRNTDLWWYLAGEYGGGTWTQKFLPLGWPGYAPFPIAGTSGRVEYNDIRMISGLEWTGSYGLKGFMEAAWVWNRQLRYDPGYVMYNPPDTFMVRLGLTY